MKKSNFLEGAMIATVGIIICKIIGLIYVIPFYSIIGDQGGTLYGYAYSIYAIFLSLSTSGIPIAMSKLISEYNALGYFHTKEKTYRIGLFIITGIGFASFLLLLFFAPQIASIILGDLQGGNTIAGVSLVIRIVATALLIVPLFSVTKGYLQGHNFMTPPSIANIVEQLVRVIVIVGGSFVAVKVFHLSIETGVGIAVFGATMGAIVAYFYLLSRIRKNRKNLNRHHFQTREETKITTKDIIHKIVFYALPFVVIDLIKSAYSMVDTFTVVRTLASLKYEAEVAELTLGVLSTWAPKLNMIVISISMGITISLIPNLASSYVKRDYFDVSKKVNQSLQAVLMITLPMALGLSFLAQPAWVIFYGYNEVSISIFRLFVFQTITFSFYSVLVDIAQTLNDTKLSLGTLIGSFLGKALLNVPLMYGFQAIGIPAYFGPVVATLMTQLIPTFIILYQLKKKYHVRYNRTWKISIKTLLCVAIMGMLLLILHLFIPVQVKSRSMAVIVGIVYGLAGGSIYVIMAYQSKLLHSIFGRDFVNGWLYKLHLKKK